VVQNILLLLFNYPFTKLPNPIEGLAFGFNRKSQIANHRLKVLSPPSSCSQPSGLPPFSPMELELQPELIEVKSPIDRFKEQLAQQPGVAGFLRQRNLVLQHPELVQYADLARAKGWTQPLGFALQGLVLSAFLLSGLNWWISHDHRQQAGEIAAVRAELESSDKTQQAVVAAAEFESTRIKHSRYSAGFTVASSHNLTKDDALAQLDSLIEETRKSQDEAHRKAEIKIQNLRASQDGLALAASGTPLIFCLAILFAAQLFRRQTQQQYAASKLARRADNFYLLSITSRGLWLNAGIIVILNLALSASAYGLGGAFEAIGPIGRGIFWLGIYALLLYWFLLVSKDLYKTMQLPIMGSYLSPDNRLLLYMHNSFWLVFAAFELPFLLLASAVYWLEKA
jgi:hypothetical protein